MGRAGCYGAQMIRIDDNCTFTKCHECVQIPFSEFGTIHLYYHWLGVQPFFNRKKTGEMEDESARTRSSRRISHEIRQNNAICNERRIARVQEFLDEVLGTSLKGMDLAEFLTHLKSGVLLCKVAKCEYVELNGLGATYQRMENANRFVD
jgi:hypothetical protein